MNKCKVDNVDLLLFVMKPVELISKQFTVVVSSVMSVKKGAYFLLFSLCRWSIFDVSGTVSSNMLSFFFALDDNDIWFEIESSKLNEENILISAKDLRIL